MPESNETNGETTHPADSVVMNASPVCRLFVVLSWYADEADMDDPVELAEYLAGVAERFDREENTGCGHGGDGDCDCEECEGYGEVTWTYARPAADFLMWDALGSWPHRDEFLEELYRLEGEALDAEVVIGVVRLALIAKETDLTELLALVEADQEMVRPSGEPTGG